MRIAVDTRISIAAPAHRVFDAWVEPDEMAGYFISKGSDPMAAGSTVTWTFQDQGDAQVDVEVEVLAVEPHRSLAFRWSAQGSPTRVDVAFEARDGGTEVRVREGDWEPDAAGIARFGAQTRGWTHMLTCLKAYLEYDGINLREGAGGSHEVVVESDLRASPARIYRAWTRQWPEWFGFDTKCAMVPEVGTAFWFAPEHEGRRYPHYGRYLRLEEDRLIEHTWANEPTHGAETTVRVELAPRGDGTRVRLFHGGFADRAAARGHATNWPHVLTWLDDWIARQG